MTMIQTLPFTGETGGETFLHVAELIHRIRNEYARAISFASLIASRTSSHETRTALSEMINHLHSVAETHRILCPPLAEGTVDLGEKLTQLCRALAKSAEIER